MDLLTSDTPSRLSSAAPPGEAARAPDAPQSAAARRRARAQAPPPGDTGTHWTGPNQYLLEAARRANVVVSRRHPLQENGESLGVELQRYVHFEGNRPPVRQILLHLRLLTLYPPLPDVLPDLVLLLEFENVHICRLAHYHVRAAAPITDAGLYRELVEALEREASRASPARRAAAMKTLAKVFVPQDVDRAIDFATDVFNRIGGARVRDPVDAPQPRKVAGVTIPLTDSRGKDGGNERSGEAGRAKKTGSGKEEKETLAQRMKKRPSVLGGGSALRAGAEVVPDLDESSVASGAIGSSKKTSSSALGDDDGAGGVIAPSARASAMYIKTRFGKMLVGHAVFAALRRINRVAAESCRVESYFFNSGLMSVVPSTVRHTMALLEIRSQQSPLQVSKYIAHRLPHRNPPANKRLVLEDLGAKVYFARMLGALAEDPDLVAHIPENAPQQARNAKDRRRGRSAGPKGGLGSSSAAEARAQALAGENVKEKAGNLFKFLFHKDRVAEISSSVKSSSSALVLAAGGSRNTQPRRVEDPRGVEFAEALVNLLKNASNRVLLEAVRGLSHRRWTTWFEAPIAQSALYNSPELADPNAMDVNEGRWGIEEGEDEDDEDAEGEGSGAFEDDIADEAEAEEDSQAAGAGASSGGAGGGPKLPKDGLDPDLVDPESAANKKLLSSGARQRRKEKWESRYDSKTPFYLRRVGAGMVPALEVILRRVFHAMLHDEAIRRFSAVDAVIVLSRAKMYGHSLTDEQRLQKAKMAASQQKSAFISRAVPSSSRALVVQDPGVVSGEDHPFEPLVGTLKEIMDEDSNRYVRGRAAIALAFVIASGAGRKVLDIQDSLRDIDEDDGNFSAILVRYFRSFVTREGAGRGTGFRLVSEVFDHFIYEVLDLAPELSQSAVELAELWAVTHPTIGVCGRLGAVWEKVLSLGDGAVVGASIFRAMAVKPHAERVASAAASFLRRRTLDLAVLTVGARHMAGSGVPEPLPRPISIEMEKYFSLLWHSALLGPSAECRTLSIEAIGGAAALAGDPLRVCAYERLVELVRVRGLGLKIPAENVMDALDVLYSCRERFSEARHGNQIARDGSNRSSAWLQIVWRLAAESSSAAQVLLGVPPPTGWLALGPGAATDVSNAEAMFGDVRDRQMAEKLKDPRVALQAAPSETPVLSIEDAASGGSSSRTKLGSSSSVFGFAPKNFDPAGPSASNRRRTGGYSDDDSLDDFGSRGRGRRSPSPENRDRQFSRSRSHRPRRSSRDGSDDDSYDGNRYRRSSYDRDDRYRGRERDRDYGGGRAGRHGIVDSDGHGSGDEYAERSGEFSRRRSVAGGRLDMEGVREGLGNAARRATDFTSRKEQEARDHELAKRLQKEEKGGRKLFGDDTQFASKLLKSSMKSGSGAAAKAGKLAKNLGSRGGGRS